MSEVPVFWWVSFNAFVIVMLSLDLGVFHRKAHTVSIKEALLWSAVWITLALAFNTWVYFEMGWLKATEFFTGYVVEKSLSVDNLFIIAVLFTFFGVPAIYQHKILFWGIFGALVMRALMIAAGAALLTNFAWITYVFAGILFFTGIKMLVGTDEAIDFEKNITIRLLRKVMPLTKDFHGDKFFVKQGAKWAATPMFAVLICVEFTDLIFAVDSIPAIFAITQDTFIVYTSNVFAILGLRSLYFALSGILPYFHFLKYGLGVILCFVVAKMALAHTAWKLDSLVSLGVITGILAITILASILHRRRELKH
jgi:tellurite resistance protein TerC